MCEIVGSVTKPDVCVSKPDVYAETDDFVVQNRRLCKPNIQRLRNRRVPQKIDFGTRIPVLGGPSPVE